MKRLAITFTLLFLTAVFLWSDALAQRDGSTLHTNGNNQAEWTHMAGLSTGMDGFATVILRHEDYLLFSGSFSKVGNLSVLRLVKYDLNTNEWSSVNYPGGIIRDMLINDNTLYLSSDDGIWEYDFTEEEWELDENIPGSTRSFAWYEDSLIISGNLSVDNFETYDGLVSIIRYYPESELYDVILEGPYHDMNISLVSVSGDYLIYQRFYEEIWDGYSRIVKYDLINNQQVSFLNTSEAGFIRSINTRDDDVYITGRFNSLGQTPIKSVAKLDMESFSPIRLVEQQQDTNLPLVLGPIEKYEDQVFLGASNNLNREHLWVIRDGEVSPVEGIPGNISALIEAEGVLYVSGSFETVDNALVRGIGAYDISADEWKTLFNDAEPDGYFNNTINTFFQHSENIFYGGNFDVGFGMRARGIVRHNLSTGEADNLGGGVRIVNAITIMGSNLIVGGRFTSAGGISARNIARYDLVSGEWHPFGDGASSPVNDIAIKDNRIYTGGEVNFAYARGLNVYDVGKAEWLDIGTSVRGGDVRSLALLDEELILGGSFTSYNYGEIVGRYLIKFNTDTLEWSAFGAELSDPVNDLYKYDGVLFAGTNTGLFEYDRATSSFIQRSFDNSRVNSIASIGNEIFVTGDLDIGTGERQRLASLNYETGEWTGHAAGPQSMSLTGLKAVGTDLNIGGNFSSIEGKSASNWARYSTSGEIFIPDEEPFPGPNPEPGPGPIPVPYVINLSQNVPNPFNSSTNIEFTTAESGHVNLDVYNIMGQHVATLLNESRLSGTHTVQFDAKALSSGIYVYRLRVGNTVTARKMTLVK